MIVQTAPPDLPHFVITQRDHAHTCGQMAQHFGNEDFQPLHPRDPMRYVIEHHDDGWDAIDSSPMLDPNTRLPFHLTQTPTERLLMTGKASPDANEAHHPYAGIISSMHTWGLYHGRYGLSDKQYIDAINEALRPEVERMLDDELVRQERLKSALAQDIATAAWVGEDVLFHNYKLLQFFDTLALYIQTVSPPEVVPTEFHNVPMAVNKDTTIKAIRPELFVVQLDPWPFDAPQISVTTKGRYMIPVPEATEVSDLGARLYNLPVETQTYTFVKP